MQPRIENLASLLPGTMEGVNALYKAAHAVKLPPAILELVHMRASQINGCSVCVDLGGRAFKQRGETDERMWSIAAWRETPYFSESERAALALAEAATRLADRPDAVSDEIWADAAKHFDDAQLAAIVLWIAVTNLFNRINATTRQMAPQTYS
jgi:AhpD family alkylhydroperoxidase